MFAVGIALLAVGLGTSNAGLWIPGAALMAAGVVKRVAADPRRPFRGSE